MKKQLSLLMLIWLWTSVVAAAGLDFNRVFDEVHDFGYSDNLNVAVEGFGVNENSETVFKITSPVLRDAKDTAVGEYHIVYGDKPIVNYIAGDRTDLKEFEPVSIMDIGDSVDLSIKQSQVDADKTYYGVIVPVNDNIIPGGYSKQFCFNFSKAAFSAGDDCNDFANSIPSDKPAPAVEQETVAPAQEETAVSTGLAVAVNDEDEHSAAEGADMSMADISHSVNGKVVTLTWTAVPYSDNVEIRIFDKANADYVTLGTVPMTAEKFQYTVRDSDEELLFAFIPRDAKGREFRYDVNVRHEADVTPEVKTAPKVGPAEDFAVILLVTVLLYGAYRVFTSRKAD